MPPQGLVVYSVLLYQVYNMNPNSRLHASSPLCLRGFSFLRKLLSPVGFLYNKAKSGLGKIRRSFVSSKKKAIREAIENGEVRLRLDDWASLPRWSGLHCVSLLKKMVLQPSLCFCRACWRKPYSFSTQQCCCTLRILITYVRTRSYPSYNRWPSFSCSVIR